MAVKIVTDSAGDLPLDLLDKAGIAMVPLTVHFGEEQYKDALEMGGDEFYRRLPNTQHHPRTSQPSPADFASCYERVAAGGASIVSVHLSSKLSGTYQSAILAKSMLPDLDVEVVDSKSASLGSGLMALHAARLAERGASKTAILAELAGISSRMHLIFTVDTLEYLKRNGRIGAAQHLLGTLLNMKPVLGLDREGAVAALDRVRGRSRVIPRLLELMGERVKPGTSINCAVMHAEALPSAQELMDGVRQQYRVEHGLTGNLGAVIGTHVGPGAVGIAFYSSQ